MTLSYRTRCSSDLRAAVGLGAGIGILAGGASADKALLALVLLFGEALLNLLVGALGAQRQHVGLVGGHAGLEDGGVDLRQQLALFHPVAVVDLDLLELAGDLVADIDIVERLQIGSASCRETVCQFV